MTSQSKTASSNPKSAKGKLPTQTTNFKTPTTLLVDAHTYHIMTTDKKDPLIVDLSVPNIDFSKFDFRAYHTDKSQFGNRITIKLWDKEGNRPVIFTSSQLKAGSCSMGPKGNYFTDEQLAKFEYKSKYDPVKEENAKFTMTLVDDMEDMTFIDNMKNLVRAELEVGWLEGLLKPIDRRNALAGAAIEFCNDYGLGTPKNQKEALALLAKNDIDMESNVDLADIALGNVIESFIEATFEPRECKKLKLDDVINFYFNRRVYTYPEAGEVFGEYDPPDVYKPDGTLADTSKIMVSTGDVLSVTFGHRLTRFSSKDVKVDNEIFEIHKSFEAFGFDEVAHEKKRKAVDELRERQAKRRQMVEELSK